MKTNKTAKTIGIVFLVLLILLLWCAIIAFGLVFHYSGKLNSETASGGIGSAVGSLLSGDEDGVTNILLIGVDNDNTAGMNDLGNADGMIIASINRDTKEIVLTSLMRDIKVELPGGGYTKLTLSYHQGGTPMLIETIEKNFGIDIDNYVLVNYLDVVQIVDAVGGITLDVNSDELYHMQIKIANINGLLGLDSGANMIPPENAGELTLNGVQTAAYMRVRMAGNNDVERTERARRVLMQLKDRVFDMDLAGLNDFANTALPCITTDMAQADILSLLLGSAGYMKYEIVSGMLPVEGSYYYSQDGNAFVVMDFEENKDYLYKAVYEGIH